MELEKQVCSPELAKRLKELGVKQDAFFDWVQTGKWWRCQISNKGATVFGGEPETNSTFTVSELGEMLKSSNSFQSFDEDGQWCCWRKEAVMHAATEANVRAKMLIYLLENQLITSE
jgi:hypothetical protein